MSGRSWEELETSGLMPAGIRSNGDADWYVDMDNPIWKDDLKETLRYLATNPEKINEIEIYQRCSASTKRSELTTFYPLSQYELKDNKFATSLRVKMNLVNLEKALVYKANNLPILRMYMMGDSNEPIRCPWTQQQIDSLMYDGEQPFNIWEQHHFKVINRASVQKEGSDPGEILRSTDFNTPSPRSRLAIEDMMRTVFLSPTGHKIVHNRWNNSDITNYQNHQLPWALRSESNWNRFITYLMTLGYDTFPSYLDWLTTLHLTDTDLSK